jgi:hypothetical protein
MDCPYLVDSGRGAVQIVDLLTERAHEHTDPFSPSAVGA